ncbi:MAG: bifunctional phosphopantothenoylcysteine decarboxylase/phosphopantothenate--cysteine ligase CoaBC [Methylophilales bacterium]|nr:bifunctional phosphopantothenoylcysteine decarboxylase/phosphopantothenate--cysteine ligase CoaBC [Methylophilales bacterium]
MSIPTPSKKILLGITGGIAAYKAAELVRLLVKQNMDVQAVMTASACQFITPLTLQALSGKPVLTDLWDNAGNGMSHISLARDADAIVIAPASANFITKLVHGAADDLLSTLCLARGKCPLFVAPAMNVEMWQNPATQRNVAQLAQDGIAVLGPVSGDQACGEVGLGRMLEPEALLEELETSFQPKILQGKNVMVTAGATFEAIDPVRGITNLSSGKMGYAVARAAQEMGATVTLVSAACLDAPRGVNVISVVSAQNMLDTVMAHIAKQDIFIGVAAVSDYRMTNPKPQKIKKDGNALSLELVQNTDILATVANLPKPPFCVGFAAESENLLKYAEQKRRQKNLPLLAANLVQYGFGGDENTLILLDEEGSHPLPTANKLTLARQLLQHIASLLGK